MRVPPSGLPVGLVGGQVVADVGQQLPLLLAGLVAALMMKKKKCQKSKCVGNS